MPYQMKFIYLFLWSMLLLPSLWAQNYAVSSIAPELQTNAAVVVRTDKGVFKVHSPTKCIYTTQIVYTIFNKKGEKYATKYVHYDNKFIFVNKLQGKLYDADGKKIKELKSGAIIDQSAVSDISLHEDNRVKIAQLSYPSYPYTVEFTVEIEYKSMMYAPAWYFQANEAMGVEYSDYQVITPSKYPIRFKEFYLSQKGTIHTHEGVTTYSWQQQNIKPIQKEEFTAEAPFPHVEIAPTQFELDGYAVDMSSWAAFGKWHKSLVEGRQEIPAATQTKVAELVRNIDSEEEKIKKIYEYMQSKTRYVSIQLGIGGWQPFSATFVDSKGIGDCKALSNYTQTLLKSVGITSHYTLVYAGDMVIPIDKNFPIMQFNHAILCVPLSTKKDTIWLECTSQQNSSGYMGGFTGNRQALLLTDEGGVVVNTPQYDQKTNIQQRKATFHLDIDGNATAQVHHTYQALAEGNRWYYVHQSAEKQREYLLSTWKIPTFSLEEVKFWQEKSRLPITHEEATLQIEKLAMVSGKRLFVQPNVFTKWTTIPPNTTQRTQEIVLTDEFVENDTMRFVLPENFHLETPLQNTTFHSVFGDYQTTLSMDGNQTLVYTRRFVSKKGTFPKEKYNELVEFYKKVAKTDLTKIVLVNKT